MSSSQRNKGAEGEREVCRLLWKHGWHDACRTSDGRAQIGRGDIADGPEGVHIEVRRRESLHIWGALQTAERDADDGQVPVVAFRRNRTGWYAAVPLEWLLELLADE